MEAVPPQVIALHKLDKEAAHIDCPYCEKRTTTRVQRTRSLTTKYVHNLHYVYITTDIIMTVISRLVMGLWCMFCGCCAAYCARHQYMDIDHFCTECGNQVAHKVYNHQAVPTLRSMGLEQTSKHAPLNEASLMQPIRPAETPSNMALSTPTGVANVQRSV